MKGCDIIADSWFRIWHSDGSWNWIDVIYVVLFVVTLLYSGYGGSIARLFDKLYEAFLKLPKIVRLFQRARHGRDG